MELEIGMQITLMKGETFITGELRGIRIRKDDIVEALWIHEIETAFYPSDGWLVVDDGDGDEMQELFGDTEEEDEENE